MILLSCLAIAGGKLGERHSNHLNSFAFNLIFCCSFWNGRIGALIDAYQTHIADVLSVALNPAKTMAFSAGVDPRTMHFQPISRKDGKQKWVTSINRNVHSHDVRAIVALDRVVYSAGVDASIAISDLLSKTTVKLPPLPPGDPIRIARYANMVLFRYEKYLEVWKLGESLGDTTHATSETQLPLKTEPLKLLHLQTKDDETIRSCDISDDGKWIMYATTTRIRVYRLDITELSSPKLLRVNIKSSKALQIAHHVIFVEMESGVGVVSACQSGDIQILELNSKEERAGLCSTVTRKELNFSSSIAKIVSSKKWTVISDHDGNVVSFDVKSGRVIAKMPIYQTAAITSLSVHQDSVIMVYSDQKLVECDLKTGKYTKFSSGLNIDKNFTTRRCPTLGVIAERDQLVCFDCSKICIVDKNVDTSAEKNKKIQRKFGQNNPAKRENKTRILQKYQHLVQFDKLSDDSFVAVEVQPGAIESRLRPSLHRKGFGAI